MPDLFWCKEWCAAMADKITDLFYADESRETLDVINVLLLGWILLALAVYVLGNVIWRRKKAAIPPPPPKLPPRTPSVDEGTSSAVADNDVAPFSESLPPPEVEVREEEGECEPGGGELSEWVRAVLAWAKRERVVSPLADAWLEALNASTRLASTEHGLLVDFRNILPTSRPPKVKALQQIEGEQAVECEVELRGASFGLGVRGGESTTSPLPYVAHLRHLHGKVNVECHPRDVSFVARFLDPPDLDLHVEPSNDIQDVDELCSVVREVCEEALRGSCVRLRLACFPECPRPPATLAPKLKSESPLLQVEEGGGGRELLVRVIRAEDLREDVCRPLCVLEVDDPPQRHATPPAQGPHPHFDAPFLISVKDSAELLFEVYDQKNETGVGEGELLGLCMVEVEELVRSPSQRQVVPLTSLTHGAPAQGTLTLEFVFPESQRVETNSRVTAQGTLITTTTIQRSHQERSSVPLEVEACASANPNPSSLHANDGETLYPEGPSQDANHDAHPLQANHEYDAHPLQNTTQTAGHNLHAANSMALNDKTPQNETKNIQQLADSAVKQEASLNVIHNPHSNNLQDTNSKVDETPHTIMENIDPLSDPTVELNAPDLDLSASSTLPVQLSAEGKASRDLPDQSTELKQPDSDEAETELESEPKVDLHVPNGNTRTLQVNMHADPPVELKTSNGELAPESKAPNGRMVTPNIDSHAGNAETGSIVVENENGTEAQSESTLHAIGNGKSHYEKQKSASRKGVPVIRPPPAILVSASSEEGAARGADKEWVAGRALAQLGASPSGTSRSTLIIHSVHRPDSSPEPRSEPASPQPQARSEVSSTPAGGGRGVLGALRRRLSLRSRSSERSNPASPRHHTLGGSSARSSVSEASGVSAATFTHENSTLVIETNENGIVRRYLIPGGGSHRKRGHPRGAKLHIFNDHVFTAKHLTGSVSCCVCGRHLTRRPGKQGYECRGCGVRCHKSCHVRVQDFCPNSSVNAMEVEYIHDPKGASPKSI